MSVAGYSGTPLIKKLGISASMKILLIDEPDDYFNLLKQNISSQLVEKNEQADLVHLFVKSLPAFEKEMNDLKKLYKAHPSVIIWVSWYKKNSGMQTDVTENTIRQYALANDLVDVKVCAVSELWSGLKLVVPKNRR